MALQHLRSSTADKRPTPAAMSDGQLAMNTNLASPGLFLKDSNGDLVKVGPVHVGTTAPNATPGAGGQAGNSKGEQWLDTSSSRYVFKIWDGTDWRTEDGEFVNVSGDTLTGALGIIAGTNTAPGVFFSGDTNTGIYSPGADQLAISTNAVERVEFGTSEVVFNDGGANYDFRIEGDTNANLLFVDASTDCVGIGTTSPNVALTVNSGAISAGALVPTSDIAFPSAHGNGFFRAVGNYNQGAGVGGTLQLGGKSYTDSGFIGAFLISAVSGGNATDALTFSTQTSFNNVVSEKMRLDTSGRLLVGTSSDSGGALLQVNDNRIRIATANTPASAGATGTTGEIAWDADYIYVCTATNTWKRTAIATW
jgi:hypothetical protein